MKALRLACAACLVGVGFATGAASSDGALEINQACAEVGCFPGDDPGFPVQITAGGSYRLTSHLAVPSDLNGVFISGAPGVSLDMGGFTISGGGDSDTAAVLATAAAVHAFDGVVTGFGSPSSIRLQGASSVVERVRTVSGRLDVGAGGLVRDCITSHGGGVELSGSGSVVEDSVVSGGIDATQSGGRIEGNAIRGAPGSAIQALGGDGQRVVRNAIAQSSSIGVDLLRDGSLVESNLVYASGSDGVRCAQGCLVWDDAVIGSSGAGLDLGRESLYRASALIDNATPVDAGNSGVPGAGNYCSGPGTVGVTCP